jgi:DNA-directed RNA polymerase subunit RPC12/RpoP
MRLTKFNPETGEYEYVEKAKTQEGFMAQRKAAIQRLGEFEDRAEGEWECESGDDEYLCSNCKQLAPLSIRQIHEVQSAYCPWCGTKMKGEKR